MPKRLTQLIERIRFFLGIDTDNEYAYKPEGTYFSGKDVSFITDTGNATQSIQNILGNEFVYQPEDIVLQNRIFRIYISSTTVGTYKFRFEDANGVAIALATNVIVTVGNIAVTLNDIAVADPNSITNVLIAGGQTFNISTTVTGTDEGYITVELTTVNYWNYNILNTNISGNSLIAHIILTQEAVDQSLIGTWKNIGSFDLEGEMISWWTTQSFLPSELDIIGDANNAGQVELTTPVPHGRVTNEKINVIGSGNADGEWIITATGLTTLILNGSVFGGVWSGAGIIVINPNGNGEIGRATKNEVTKAWTYYRLIRSQVFNLTTENKVDAECKKDSLSKNYYWTDNANVPKVLYDYTEIYQNDVLLTFIDPLNTYEYLTLGVESILEQSGLDATLTFTGQTQVGGNLTSGNKRYCLRGLTETLTTTEWSLLINPIPQALSSELGLGFDFFGNPPNTPTGKINNFLATGNFLGVIKYLELAVVEYQGSAISGYIVGRFEVTSNSMILQHTGYEQNIQNLDVGTLNAFIDPIGTAKSISSQNGYLTFSNIRAKPLIDLTDWFQTWEHTLGYETMLGVGNYNTIQNAGLRVGEYQLSDNCYRILGNQIFETKRYSAKVLYTNGAYSQDFWIDDIIFTTGNVNNINTSTPGFVDRRITGLSDYNLTTGASSDPIPQTAYVEFSGFDLEAIVQGRKVRDYIKRIYIMQVELTPYNRTVLATGMLIPTVEGFVGVDLGMSPGSNNIRYVNPANTVVNLSGEFPFVGGINEATELPSITNPNYPYLGASGTNDFVYNPLIAAFHSTDIAFGHTTIVPQVDFDVIINLGQPFYDTANNLVVGNGIYAPVAGTQTYYSYLMETTGLTNSTVTGGGIAPNAPDILNVKECQFVAKGGEALFTGALYSKHLRIQRFTDFQFDFWDIQGSLVIRTDTAGGFIRRTAQGGANNRGYYFGIYKRPKTVENQYGAKNLSRYVWTGTQINVDQTTISPFPTGTHVFGAETFTQRAYLKNRYSLTNAVPGFGFGSGVAMYEQNQMNFQMRNENGGSGTLEAFPLIGTPPDPIAWLETLSNEPLSYNEGYTPRNGVTSYIAFDPLVRIPYKFQTRIKWSAREIPNSSFDAWRLFKTLNFKDLPFSYGEIVNHDTFDDNYLWTWQPLQVFKNPFIPNAIFTTKDGQEVLLGDGAIMSREPIDETNYGCSNKDSIITGLSEKGNKVWYWTDTIKKEWIRLAGDGTTVQSMLHGMHNFFQKNLNIVIGKDSYDQGICSTWNQPNREAITTVRAWRDDIEAWVDPVTPNLYDFALNNAPYGDLIEVGGLFYGTNSAAGGFGELFSFDPLTLTYTILHTFGGGTDGLVPRAGLTLAGNGKLYGATSNGGANAVGTIYEYDIGLATYTKKIDMVVIVGSLPTCKMVESGGYLWGMTTDDAVNGFGSIFRYDYTGNAYLDVWDFDGTTGGQLGGSSFNSLIIVGTDLYGMTYRGGVNNAGVIFKFDPILLIYTKLYDFTMITGSNPAHSLTLLNNILYGMTLGGGANNKGVLFRYDYVNNSYIDIHDFNGGATDGQSPQSSLTAVGNILFGTTAFGGSANLGVVFSYNTLTNIFSIVQAFVGINGQDPRSGLLLYNNTLYGMARNGGGLGGGVIYALSLTYNTGSVVSIGTLTGYEQIPAFYRSLIDGNMSAPPSPTWELIPFSDYNYYNFYTLIYNELKNYFTCDDSTWHPKTYQQFKNGYLSPDPIHENKIYEHGRGEYGIWYSGQEEDAYITVLFAKDPDAPKRFDAIMCNPEETPARVDFYTHNSQGDMHTFVVAADFDNINSEYGAALRYDTLSSPTGSRDGRTSKLWGYYVLIKLTYPPRRRQKLVSIVLKYIELPRNYQT